MQERGKWLLLTRDEMELDNLDEGVMVSRELDDIVPEIKWPGRLDQGIENPSVWRGNISAKLSVIKDRFNLADEAEARDKIEWLRNQIGHFYKKAGVNSVVRCIDGRGEGGSLPDDTDLGPQVPGGTPITSIGYRFAQKLKTDATVESDFVEYREVVKKLGLDFISGAHEDCGAIAKMHEILHVMREYDKDERGQRRYHVYEYAKAITGVYMDEEDFDNTFADVQVNLQALLGPHFYDRYFQTDEHDSHQQLRDKILHRVKEDGHHHGKKTVEETVGEHNEVFLMVNHVIGETFDRDGFANLTGGLAQAFNYDAWVIAERAKAIFPDDKEKQRIMIVTNTMYAVAAAMVLTDGSLELGIRK